MSKTNLGAWGDVEPDDEEQAAAPATEPAASPAKAPAASPAKAPAASPAKTPAASPARAPAASPAKVPAASPAKDQAAAPAEAPAAGTPEKATSPEADTLAATLDAATIGNGDGTVDQPEMAMKADTLNEEVEAPETEVKKVVVNDTPYVSAKTFEELRLSDALLQGLYNNMKFSRPSRIQAETLPLIVQPPYANLIAQAHNGSGKTTCFVLGMLSRVDPNIRAPQALCVCPTRELVVQNVDVLERMGAFTGITCCSTAEGGDERGYSSSRRSRIVDQVVIGTPGRLKRWLSLDRILSTKQMRILVFDEADHMLDQDGFQDDSMRIIKEIKRDVPNVQILLFSATFSERVKQFAMRTIPDANQVFVPRESLSLDVIKQYRVKCPSVDKKAEVLRQRVFPAAEKLGQSIIFVRTRETARNLHQQLAAEGHKCTSIEGGMEHSMRDRVIKEFRAGTTKILISTDVLARGFDQAQVTLVVNYDVPIDSKSGEPAYELYLHRIGRSGRFGRKGAAFNLVTGQRDEWQLDKIQRHFNRDIPEIPYDDDEAFEVALKEAGLA